MNLLTLQTNVNCDAIHSKECEKSEGIYFHQISFKLYIYLPQVKIEMFKIIFFNATKWCKRQKNISVNVFLLPMGKF